MHRRFTGPRLAALCLLPLVAALAACDDGPAPGAPPRTPPREGRVEDVLRPVARVLPAELDECSGLVRWQGAWWTHEDSGAKPLLWRAETPDFAEAESFDVPGAANLDWEDVAPDGDTLLVADFGDNLRVRKSVALHRVRFVAAAPASPGRIERSATYAVAWPDGAHDCEAVAVIDGKLHAVTKDRGDDTRLYRFGELREGGTNVPEEIARLDLGDREQVTSAAFDEKSRSLILLTYTQIARYPVDRLSGVPADATWIGARQSEAIAIDGEDLVFTNEQRDVFRIERFRDWRYSRLLPPRTRTRVAAEEAPLPLADAGTGEELRWRLDGDVLRFRATFRCADDPRPSDPSKGTIGTGLLVAFGTEDRSHVSGDETVLAAMLGADGKAEVHEVAFAENRTVLGPAPGATATFRRDGENVVVEAAIPARLAFDGSPLPSRFLFFAQGTKLGRDPPPRCGGADAWALYRPYLWAEVTR